MGEKVTCEALVEGGKASAGPPIGPTLGGTGVNLLDIVKEINEKTKDFTGLKVPVKIIADTGTKQFEVEVGMPPTSALLINAAKASQGTGTAGTDFVGSISFDQVVKIAKSKQEKLTAGSLKTMVKTVLGTAQSCGIKVDDKPAPEIIDGINQGEFDDQLSQ